jgi:ElaB/YqjD/DUF883 family membrane-anchored ribosome-binding protein
MQTKVENGLKTAAKLAHLSAKAAEGKMLAEDLVEIGKRKAQRMVRRGYETGEDYLDDTRHYIKHNPFEAVAIAVGVGAFVGLMIGLICAKGSKR